MTDVTVTLRAIQERIATAAADAGRKQSEIRLIAVSKSKPYPMIQAALDAGQLDFGENYVQEATGKIRTLAGAGAIWHFIGRIQSNKTRAIAAHFDWVQTIDRESIARRLNTHRAPVLVPLEVCIQVGLSDDADRAGAPPDKVEQLAQVVETLPRLRLRGLMCMPPAESDPGRQRNHVDRVKALFDSLRDKGHALDTLSMGTTTDLEVAIAGGSTMVRVGTAIFGERR